MAFAIFSYAMEPHLTHCCGRVDATAVTVTAGGGGGGEWGRGRIYTINRGFTLMQI